MVNCSNTGQLIYRGEITVLAHFNETHSWCMNYFVCNHFHNTCIHVHVHVIKAKIVNGLDVIRVKATTRDCVN